MTSDELLLPIDVSRLYLPFLAKLRGALASAITDGFDAPATVGHLTLSEQQGLYLQGRHTPGPHAGKPGHPTMGLIVTTEMPGFSPSNYGIAVTFAAKEESWPLLVHHASERGLVARDGNRIALDLASRGLTERVLWLEQQKHRDEREGFKAVHALLDGASPW